MKNSQKCGACQQHHYRTERTYVCDMTWLAKTIFGTLVTAGEAHANEMTWQRKSRGEALSQMDYAMTRDEL